jgi:hypothetical protein
MRVLQEGFGHELDWYEQRATSTIDAKTFLSETAWVILNSGFRESVVRRHFPHISTAFDGFRCAERILGDSARMVRAGCRVLANKPKMKAIVNAAQWWMATGESEVLRMRRDGRIDPLMEIPYIGSITVWHLAKNLGFGVAKPDRHVQRIASQLGFPDTHSLCGEIGCALDLSPAIVDTVFWRYATIEPAYLARFDRKSLWRTARDAVATATAN